MATIAKLGKDAFGAEITRALSRETGELVASPRVYQVLSKLEDEGFVSGKTEEKRQQGERGKSKRLYELNETAFAALKILQLPA